MDEIVYYATWNPDGDEWFIGIFSESYKAQEACQRFHDNAYRNDRELDWIGSGDALAARAGNASFEIDAIQMDHAIRAQDYNPPIYAHEAKDGSDPRDY